MRFPFRVRRRQALPYAVLNVSLQNLDLIHPDGAQLGGPARISDVELVVTPPASLLRV